MTKVISLFNHKGGVSKTTTTFHLGWALANLGLKVLIVDADPQCNLTGLSLGIEDYDGLFKFYDSIQNSNIYGSLAREFGFSDIISRDSVIPAKTKNSNLSLLAGHINFAKFDLQLATALTSSNSIPILKPLLSAINTLIRKTAERGQFDIVLIDMSPSISATNMCIFMASDYFIIPTSPDFYCYQAIDSLSEVLPEWSKRMQPFKDAITLPRNNPKMLGVISQNYRVYGTNEEEGSKKMTSAFAEWATKIKSITNTKLSPSLKKAEMVVEEKLFSEAVKYDTPYNLANIQDFNTLIPISQKLSKPIFELTDKDGGWKGAVWTQKQGGKDVGVQHKIEEAKKIYQRLAESICKLIELPICADKEIFDALIKKASKSSL